MKTHTNRVDASQQPTAAATSTALESARNPQGATTTQLHGLQAAIDQSPRMLAQRGTLQRMVEPAASNPVAVVSQRVADALVNETGMPDQLKSGIESLSGMDLSGVRVHRNSDKPAQLNALAYAQGSDIHLGPGQEQHLPHEAWHVVQQAQGKVAPTMHMNDGTPVNDDSTLEREADRMGARALQAKRDPGRTTARHSDTASLAPTIQRKLGFEFEILVNTDTEGDDDDPLVSVKKQDEVDELFGNPGQKQFDVVSDNSRGNMVVNKSDYSRLSSAVRNRKILEIVTAPVDEFASGARAKLAAQMDKLVLFGTAIETQTQHLTQPVSLQAICTEFLRLLGDASYKVQQKDDVIIGRDQAALNAEGVRTGVQTRLQSLAASTHYTVGIDFEKLPDYVTSLIANPEVSNRQRDGVAQKTILGQANGHAATLMADASVTAVDLHGADSAVKGFFLSVIMNLLFGKIDQDGLDKNFSPILNRTDGVLTLNTIDAGKPGVKAALKANWPAISAKIKQLTGAVGGNRAMHGDASFPTVDTYLSNLVNAGADGFTQAFGGMKKLGPEDVGEDFLFDAREKGFVYENRAMKGGGAGQRYELDQWKAFALSVFDAVKTVNTKPSGKKL